ncbi:MAG: 2'-5' RNA ligase family protein [Bacteroidia bacterium]|nr:2'-5' RNA ligase family protein [Bacteroidia bacterium]
MTKPKPKLYFIAIVPGEPVFSEILAFKTEFKDRFNSTAALRSPPHITLHMPFKWNQDKEDELIKPLCTLAGEQQSFKLSLHDFGAFPPRVIFVQVNENTELNKLQQVVQNIAKTKWHIHTPGSGTQRPFRPHMTIAFRDLKKSAFHGAWVEFKERRYVNTFEVKDLCLLKHNGKSWDVMERILLSSM